MEDKNRMLGGGGTIEGDNDKFKSVSCAPRDQTDPGINETKDFSCYSSKSSRQVEITLE